MQQRGALAQCLAHQSNIALRQVAHAAMHQLGGARGGAFGKVMRLDQHHAKTARRCVQRHAQAGRAAAHNGDVIVARRGQTADQFGPMGE